MIVLFGALTLLDALLLWLLIGARGHWALKLVMMCLVLGFNFLTLSALYTGAGYPSSSAPPASSLFVDCIVHEPNVQTGDAGRIYFWLVPFSEKKVLLGYDPAQNTPRAYKLAYSRSLHEQCEASKDAKKAGHQVALVRKKQKGAKGDMTAGKYQAYILPPITAPRKQPQP